jgi:hypothetical protein
MLGQSGYSRANDALRRLSNEVEHRPLVTVAVAVGVGILVGLASRSVAAGLTPLRPTGPKILTFLTMSNVQQAIRDAAERGGYRYRWWKVDDLEHNEGYNGLQLRALSEHLQDPDSGKHCLRRASGKIQTLGAFTGTASSTTWQMEKMRTAFSPLYESRRQLFANAFMTSSRVAA